MCDNNILENDGMLRFIPDCCKNQKMWDKTVDNYSHLLEFARIPIRLEKYVIRELIFMLLQYSLFLIDIRLKKCVVKLLILVLLYLILFLTDAM